MNLNNLTPDIISGLCYTDFIALLKETNRCPGGKKTIRRIRELLHIDKNSKILDVGSNTGFTSLEFARITPALIYGIEISEACVEASNKILSEDIEDIKSRVNFQLANAYDIPFKENTFDIIMVGGATSFMARKNIAISEYFRVLKPWGFLVMSPLTYHKDPPVAITDSVGEILNNRINPMKKEDWLKVVYEAVSEFELYTHESQKLNARTQNDIDAYVQYFLKKDHIQKLTPDVIEAIKIKWLEIINVFNENHKYLGYDIMIFRKRTDSEEPELFI